MWSACIHRALAYYGRRLLLPVSSYHQLVQKCTLPLTRRLSFLRHFHCDYSGRSSFIMTIHDYLCNNTPLLWPTAAPRRQLILIHSLADYSLLGCPGCQQFRSTLPLWEDAVHLVSKCLLSLGLTSVLSSALSFSYSKKGCPYLGKSQKKS